MLSGWLVYYTCMGIINVHLWYVDTRNYCRKNLSNLRPPFFNEVVLLKYTCTVLQHWIKITPRFNEESMWFWMAVYSLVIGHDSW